jgi:DNA-binding NtrC family response regulator
LASVTRQSCPRRALIVDDDQEMCWVFEVALASVGCVATLAGSALDAIAVASEQVFPIAFVDARLPDMDGLRLVDELRALQPGIRITVISGYFFEDDERISKAIQPSRIHGFLAKPFQIDAIVRASGVKA